jgi:phospholipid N-methyltransferase
MQIDATYSPEDNKLRLYPSARLDAETYARVKEAGYSWAPKQGLFVAPMWTPERAALAEELAGEIGDEGTSREERAEQRAERFGEYSDKRAGDSAAASAEVRRITSGIPLGQPILIGHHSERHARKDAERIERAMGKAVKMWETAEYWDQRAKGALRDALYKERPDVRARRIKRLEADLRKVTKNRDNSAALLKGWERIDEPGFLKLKAGGESTREQRAIYLASLGWGYTREFPLSEFPRPEGASKYEGTRSVADALKEGIVTVAWVVEYCSGRSRASRDSAQKWVDHYTFRLAYERAMMGEAGGIPTDQTKPQKGGAIGGLWAPRGGWAYIQKVNRLSVSILYTYNAGGRPFSRVVPFDKVREVMTAEQVDEARKAGRVRDVLGPKGERIGFHLAQKATQPAEDNVCPDGAGCPDPECQTERERQGLPVETLEPIDSQQDEIEAMRASLKAGVQITTSPTLYPTPPDLARRMADLADIRSGHRVLEPSAGTGNLVMAIAGTCPGVSVTAVELSLPLANSLATRCKGVPVIPGDFLDKEAFELGAPFDRIVMNPPFNGGDDIRHVLHARKLLKPDGLLVGICAGGPRQAAQLQPLCDTWEPLPAGTFEQAGTSVNTVLFTMGAE